MNAVLTLLTLSALIGVALGRFSWLVIAVSSGVLAIFAAVVLHRQGFGGLSGIATIVVCLTVHQVAYLVGILIVDRWPKGPISKGGRQVSTPASQ